MKLSFKEIKQLAASHNLNLVGISNFPISQKNLDAFKKWQEEKMYGDMDYMAKDSDLFVEPKNFLPEFKSIFSFAVNYSRKPHPEFKKGYGRVSRYAWGKDYHRVLRKSLKKVAAKLEEAFGSQFKYRIFSDAVPLLERAIAKNAGIGFVGKNTMVIRPGQGSFYFLAELLTNLEVEDIQLNIIEDNCGTCSRCQVDCPTDAFSEEYVLDARKCISYLTIEKRGELNSWEQDAIGEWVFGCDICQEVCPFNYTALKKELAPDLDEFNAEHGCGPLLNLEEVLSIRTDKEFLDKFAGTPLMRPKREGLLRNAAIVAANTKTTDLIPVLKNITKEDKSELIRFFSAEALEKLEKCN